MLPFTYLSTNLIDSTNRFQTQPDPNLLSQQAHFALQILQVVENEQTQQQDECTLAYLAQIKNQFKRDAELLQNCLKDSLLFPQSNSTSSQPQLPDSCL